MVTRLLNKYGALGSCSKNVALEIYTAICLGFDQIFKSLYLANQRVAGPRRRKSAFSQPTKPLADERLQRSIVSARVLSESL